VSIVQVCYAQVHRYSRGGKGKEKVKAKATVVLLVTDPYGDNGKET
jgi:hypothetical protein